MFVLLQTGWFGPDGHLYPKSIDRVPTEVPDEFLSILPRSAKVVEAVAVLQPAKVETLKDLDPGRQDQTALENWMKAKSAEQGDDEPQNEDDEAANLAAKRAAFAAELEAEKQNKKPRRAKK